MIALRRVRCPVCRGTGRVRRDLAGIRGLRLRCLVCGGSGKLEVEFVAGGCGAQSPAAVAGAEVRP